ncbi:FecR family protein [Alistipes onderdonkii]|uniref:FecR family protein n=1 Tax=Alistipes onderdonkii TaxID=328813 RepID=UPI0036F426D2
MRKNYIKEIIETFLGNEMPQEVQQAFGDWLRDPEARTEKEQTLETYWERLEAAERPDRDRKLARLHEAIRREESFRRRSLWRKVAAAAAVVLLAVGVNYFAAQGYLRSRVQTNIVTSAHDKGEYVLPDGTRIWLNAGSVLRYYGDLSGRKRVVELTGEAFFKVRHDEKRPFILKADDMNIEVLGTEFDFINYAEFSTTEVILCSGSVRAFGGRLPRPVILKPGERLAYSKKDGRISLSQVTALNYSQWMNGELSFDNAPLSDIIANLQRWYAVEIDCPEEWARQVRMSFAVIRNESIDEILKAMSLVVDINYARENRHVTIIPRESRNHK